jgi:hypothetical protein
VPAKEIASHEPLSGIGQRRQSSESTHAMVAEATDRRRRGYSGDNGACGLARWAAKYGRNGFVAIAFANCNHEGVLDGASS